MLAVTVNAGGASPHARSTQRANAMHEWALQTIAEREPAFVFAQEVPSAAWIGAWTNSGYGVVEPPPTYRTRSAILFRKDLYVRALTAETLPTLGYHGSYVAAASWEHEKLPIPVTLFSMHASPSPVTPSWMANWPKGVRPPKPRHGGDRVRHSGKLWDADMVLQTVLLAAESGPVLAAGDLNESRDWDEHHPGETWGREFFERIDGSLVDDCLSGRLPPGTATHWMAGAPILQIDHVLASRDVAPLLGTDVEIDPAWVDPEEAAGRDLSDHAPVWFSLDI